MTDFLGSSDGKASAYNAEDPGSIPGSGRFTGKGNGNPLQYSCLENPMDGGAWQATVQGVTESDATEPRHFHFHFPWYLSKDYYFFGFLLDYHLLLGAFPLDHSIYISTLPGITWCSVAKTLGPQCRALWSLVREQDATNKSVYSATKDLTCSN